MEDDVLERLEDKLAARAEQITDRLLDALESGEAEVKAVISGIKELKSILEELLKKVETPKLEIVVRVEE